MENVNNEIYGVSFEYGMPVYVRKFSNNEEAEKWFCEEDYSYREKVFLPKDDVLEIFRMKECDLNETITYYEWDDDEIEYVTNKIIIYKGKELKVFSTARYKGRIYNILEHAKDISTADDFYFSAIAERKGKFYIVRWDCIGESEIGFEDSADWQYLSDIEREIEFDDNYELDGKPIEKMILNKYEENKMKKYMVKVGAYYV